MTLNNCISYNNFVGYNLYNFKVGSLYMNNCSDNGSVTGMTVGGTTGQMYLKYITLSNNSGGAINTDGTATSGLQATDVNVYNPGINANEANSCVCINSMSNSDINITATVNQLTPNIVIYGYNCSNVTLTANITTNNSYSGKAIDFASSSNINISGNVKTSYTVGLFIDTGTNITSSVSVDANNWLAYEAIGSCSNLLVSNCVVQNSAGSPTLEAAFDGPLDHRR